MDQNTKTHFMNQPFFIGIDTHARQWTVTLYLNHLASYVDLVESNPVCLVETNTLRN
jgi:hypothetical protein